MFFGQDQFVAAGAVMVEAGGTSCLLTTSSGDVATKAIYQTVQVDVGEFGTQIVSKHSFTFTCVQANGKKPVIGDRVKMLPSNQVFELDDVTFDNGVLITLLGESIGA